MSDTTGAAGHESPASTHAHGGFAALASTARAFWWRLFAAFAVIDLALLPPGTPSSDGASMLAVAESLGTRGSVAVSCNFGAAGVHGQCFSNYYPLISFLAAPFVAAGRVIGSSAHAPVGFTGKFLALVVPALAAATAAVIVADLARRFGATKRGSVAVAAAFAFGTEVLTYTRSFFAETLAAMCVALAVWGFTGPANRRWLGYVGIAFGILAKPQLVLVGPAIGLVCAMSERRVQALIKPCLATAAGGIAYAGYNVVRFGSASNMGSSARELHSSAYTPGKVVEALGTLLISPGRGLIWFSPVAVLGIFALWRLRHDRLAQICIAVSMAVLVIYVGNPGLGFNWGSRYLVAILPLLIAALGALRGRIVVVAAILATIGFVTELPNTVGFYHRYYQEQAAQGRQPVDMRWSLTRTPLIGVWGSTQREIREASRTDVRTLVNRAAGQNGVEQGSDKQFLRVVATWWWMMPAAGLSRTVGFTAALVMFGCGLWLIWGMGRSRPRSLRSRWVRVWRCRRHRRAIGRVESDPASTTNQSRRWDSNP